VNAGHLGVKATREELARYGPKELMDAHAALGIPQSFDRGAPQFKPFVDGDLVTSAGVSAGIDMALHLVARFAGTERALSVQREIQYIPQPAV